MPCRAGIPHLVEMQQKYDSKGVVLLALSYEPAATVQRYLKENQRITYIVGAGAKATQDAYGVRGFPTMFIIDPEGEIAWIGHPNGPEAEKAIEGVLRDTPPKSKLSLRELVAKKAYQKAGKHRKKKRYVEAIKGYAKISKRFEGTKYAKKAKAKLKKLKADKRIMAKVRKARRLANKKRCEDWLQLARSLAEGGRSGEAAKYYERIIEKFPDSRYAKTAEEELAEL